MKRFLGPVLCALSFLPVPFLPGAAEGASGCPPFTERTRTIPAGGDRHTVLPRPACVDRQAREKEQAIPLPPRCPGSGMAVYRYNRWECRAPR